jgi:SWI/SNF-related matrix-associated actin-dependent regulator 1 of chromatin subfamily A
VSLRPQQESGRDWLAARRRAYLADAPRVGKTRTFLAAAQVLGRTPVIVCPGLVRTHWRREAAALGMELPYLFSYEALVRGGYGLMRDVLRGVKGPVPDLFIADEVHYCKHAESQRTDMVLGRDGWLRRFEWAWVGSGTPMPRHPGEMWTTLAALDYESLRGHGLCSSRDWSERFLITRSRWNPFAGRMDEKVVGIKNEHILHDVLGDVFLRRTLEGPPLDVQVLTLDGEEGTLTDAATAAYIQTAIDAGTLVDIAEERYVATMRRRVGELKAPAVVAYVREILEREPQAQVALFAAHRDTLAVLRQGIDAVVESVYIDGDTPERKRQAALDDFQRGSARVFIGQSKVCETGITLSAADYALIVEPDWVAGNNVQVASRVIDSVGGRPRVVQMVALANTLDEAIVRGHHREMSIALKVNL